MEFLLRWIDRLKHPLEVHDQLRVPRRLQELQGHLLESLIALGVVLRGRVELFLGEKVVGVKPGGEGPLLPGLAGVDGLGELLSVQVVPPGVLVLALPEVSHHQRGTLTVNQQQVPSLVVDDASQGVELPDGAAVDDLSRDLGEHGDVAGVHVYDVELGDREA